jgi:uncharacterized protein YgiM (DUF1202 family)
MAFAPAVSFSDLQPGDVLFFQNTVWTGLSHTAIYIGGGRFIHAEWYNRGVVISSFTNDPVDYNYWQGHYLGANRPWAGAAGATTVAPPSAPRPAAAASALGGSAGSQVPAQSPSGPAARVRVAFLNVRSSPSLYAAVRTVARRGTRVLLLGHRRGWYRVTLPDGVTGWVIGAGIGKRSFPLLQTRRVAATVPRRVTQRRTTTAVRRSLVVSQSHGAVFVRVNGLRVHTAPALAAPVSGSAGLGERLTVLRRTAGWIHVRLPTGQAGWISSAYATGSSAPRAVAAGMSRRRTVRLPATRPAATGATARSTGRTAAATGSASAVTTARAALNVRRTPSLAGTIMSIVSPGGTFRVLGWWQGWAHVLLANRGSGWISGSVIPYAGATHPTSRTTAGTSASAARSVVTAGVRLHSAPGLSRPVIGLVAAGTRVQVLGASSGWTRVRLPTKQVGYILGVYVRG